MTIELELINHVAKAINLEICGGNVGRAQLLWADPKMRGDRLREAKAALVAIKSFRSAELTCLCSSLSFEDEDHPVAG